MTRGIDTAMVELFKRIVATMPSYQVKAYLADCIKIDRPNAATEAAMRRIAERLGAK